MEKAQTIGSARIFGRCFGEIVVPRRSAISIRCSAWHKKLLQLPCKKACGDYQTITWCRRVMGAATMWRNYRDLPSGARANIHNIGEQKRIGHVPSAIMKGRRKMACPLLPPLFLEPALRLFGGICIFDLHETGELGCHAIAGGVLDACQQRDRHEHGRYIGRASRI